MDPEKKTRDREKPQNSRDKSHHNQHIYIKCENIKHSTHRTPAIKDKMDNLDLIKMENLCISKKTTLGK